MDSKELTVENRILALYGQGDTDEALKLFIAEYQGRLYSLAYQMLSNHDDAMDALQEILFQVNRSLPKFRGQSGLYTWVYRLASNVCLTFRKKRQKIKHHVTFEDSMLQNELLPIERPNEDPDKMCETKYKQFLVRQAIARLPETQRVLLVLHDLEGVTIVQAAQIVGIELSAAKARLHRGRAALKRLIMDGMTVKGMEGVGSALFGAAGEVVE
ncbi:MAG: RNA polymerase sigma factor [Sporomusaceae bacterium]|nr:RNA polymerase sigma factor [Sporomusaceae bacterium]